MARAYGLDLRRRVIEAIDEGMSARAAAARFSIGVSTAIAWHRQWRDQGTVEPGRQGKPSRSRLDPHEAFIVELIENQADIALHEITERLAQARGLQVGRVTVWYFLSKRGWTYKKRPPTPANSSGQTCSPGAGPGSMRSRIWTRTA